MSAVEAPVKFKVVEDDDRGNFIPRLVNFDVRAMLNYENMVYTMMEQSNPEYQGGMWDFIEFANGAKAMVLRDYDKQIDVIEQPNYFSGSISLFDLCIAINICVSSRLSFVTKGMAQRNLANNYHLLRDVAGNQPNGAQIFGYID